MLQWLIYGDLPPVGAHVDLRQSASTELSFPGYTVQWLNSGTAALAAAILIAKSRRSDTDQPEVVFPAYGCPDLLAAAQFAGVRPVLVDTESDDPAYSAEGLQAAIGANTVAVVAVNFLGVRERLMGIRESIGARDVLLIEDNAQWFPEPVQAPALQGDLVCLSFGRGKPVSLLGGGALLVRNGFLRPLEKVARADAIGRRGLLIKSLIFNSLLHKHLYWLVNRNPLFSIGETKFKPLSKICEMDAVRRSAVTGNVVRVLSQTRVNESMWTDALKGLEGWAPLTTKIDPARCGRLLRFPVLCRDARLRDAAVQALNAAGLGATRMYQRPLPEIEGVAGGFSFNQNYPGSKSLAERLLTLPLHAQVSGRVIARAVQILSILD